MRFRGVSKILLIVTLILGLTMGLTVSAFADQSKSYVALGDSLAVGYGDVILDQWGLGQRLGFGGYVSRFHAYLDSNDNVKLNNLGVLGMTSSELVWALKKDPKFKKAVRKADYITLNIGGNDLLNLLRSGNLEEEDLLKPYLLHT